MVNTASCSSSSLHLVFVLIIISPLLCFLFFAPCTVSAVPTVSPAQRMMRMRMRTMMMVEEKEKALIIGEKTRLGSTPPTCHNKCNQCHPCWAVQVPTLPSHNREELNRRQEDHSKINGRKFVSEFYDDVDFERYGSGGGGNRYSNYKPLGWQCLCREQFFNP